MKKLLHVTFIPLFGCTLLIAAACGGNTSPQGQENYRQERMIAPDFDADDSENPEVREIPHCPDCSREPKITRLPYLKHSEDEDNLEKIPVPYGDI